MPIGLDAVNFTAVHSNGTVDVELAAAIARLSPAKPPAATTAAATPVPAVAPTPAQTTVATGSERTGSGDREVTELIPFPWSPASTIQTLNGSAFPPYRTVFIRGECTANDFAKPEPSPFGPTTINTNKTCFSCFRIPTLLAGQTPGVIHAFAEARRGELTGSFHTYTGSGAGSCPDGPDTRLAYKRSADYGASWSPIMIFLQPANERAENGHCQSQAAPFIDPSTKTLFVGFNADGPQCTTRGKGFSSTPMLVNSSNEGLTWSAPYLPLVNQPQGPPVPARAGSMTIGPTKGLTVKTPSGGVRLMIPGENGWSASVYSDDHGKTCAHRNIAPIIDDSPLCVYEYIYAYEYSCEYMCAYYLLLPADGFPMRSTDPSPYHLARWTGPSAPPVFVRPA